MTKAKTNDVYKKVAEAGLPPIAKQAELLDKTFTILELRLETYEEDDGEARDYYIATIRLNGTEGLYYLSGVAVMPKLEVLAGLEDGLPSDWTLYKKKAKGGNMYDIRPPEGFEKELVAG